VRLITQPPGQTGWDDSPDRASPRPQLRYSERMMGEIYVSELNSVVGY
jgi:hypothetical protein